MVSTSEPCSKRWDKVVRAALQEFQERTDPRWASFSEIGFLALQSALTQVPFCKPLDVLGDWRKYGEALIENWDIRCAGKLIELFPTCVPKQCRNRQITAEIEDSEKGHWMLHFGAPKPVAMKEAA